MSHDLAAARQPHEAGADLRPIVPLRPKPAAPIDQDTVPIHAEYAALDLVGAANDEPIAWADVAHLPKDTGLSTAVGPGCRIS